jgi:cytochrome d ubiquinol oxidase subunit II
MAQHDRTSRTSGAPSGALSILIYVLLDGFDLGVGILFGLNRNEAQRRDMMGSIAPVWDGNETWLIVVGTVLFGAFPGGLLDLPLRLLSAGGAAAGGADPARGRLRVPLQDPARSLALGSGLRRRLALASFVQGAAIGAMVQGIASGSALRRRPLRLARPLPAALRRSGLVVGYALLGAGWLVLKTEGALRDWAYRWLPRLMTGVIGVRRLGTGGDAARRLSGRASLAGRSPGCSSCRCSRPSPPGRSIAGRGAPGHGSPIWPRVLFLTAYLMLAGSFWPWIVPYA